VDWVKVLISASTGAIIGSTLTLVSSILLDRRQRILRYKTLLKTIYNELSRNRDRIMTEKRKLPNEIRTKVESGNFVKLTEQEIRLLAWSFPKPYEVQAWKAFVSSGLVSLLPDKLSECLTELYDGLFSANYLGNLSVSFFQVVAGPTRLDVETQKNIDLLYVFSDGASDGLSHRGRAPNRQGKFIPLSHQHLG